MKTLIKTLSILAIGALAAGTAVAGPGDAYAGYPAALASQKATKDPVQIALFRASASDKSNVVTKRLPSANPKATAFQTVEVSAR